MTGKYLGMGVSHVTQGNGTPILQDHKDRLFPLLSVWHLLEVPLKCSITLLSLS